MDQRQMASLNRHRFHLALLTILLCSCTSSDAAEETKRVSSETHFRLPSIDGELVQIFNEPTTQFTVVAFLGTECPLAKLYAPRLQRLSDQYSDQRVQFIGVNSNLHDSMEEVRRFTKQHGIKFPMLKDAGNKVADAYEVTRTSEVFVIDNKFQIRYHGRIDDQYQPGLTKPEPSREDLKIALNELLSGKSVSTPETEPTGCLIGRVPASDTTTEFTFAKDVSRILQKHCVECHQAGEIGPFALTEYDEVVGWGEMLIEVIDQGRMPPWHADPEVGHFVNAREMPESDKELLRNWVEGGMPLGDIAHLPPPIKVESKWQLDREPDLVLDMNKRAFQVPAEGVVEYQYFVVDPEFEEEKWVTGVQVIPGNRSVVHHCIVFIRPPDGSPFNGIGWLGGYVPGQKPLPLKEGYARHIPAGSKFVFQMHYTPTGSPHEDTSKIGLIFADKTEVTHKVYTLTGINQDFEIPPNAANYGVDGDVKHFTKNSELLGMTPHMHLRGKSFEVSSHKDGQSTLLLDVPKYDFNWQHFYVFEEPLPLAEIDALNFTATFDNSKKNPVNPDPNDHISWGDQTWQEMAIVFFAIAEPLHGDVSQPTPKVAKHGTSMNQEDKAVKFVEDFFNRFDLNHDDEILKEELPTAMRSFGFKRLNTNRDDHLDREEIKSLALKNLKK
jgi:peroxiredoxin